MTTVPGASSRRLATASAAAGQQPGVEAARLGEPAHREVGLDQPQVALDRVVGAGDDHAVGPRGDDVGHLDVGTGDRRPVDDQAPRARRARRW